MPNEKAGKIYILRNSYFKDAVIKIGRTSRLSEQRAKEISGGTGVPSEFEVLFEEDVFDAHKAEKLIHQKLKATRISAKREFFRVPLKDAVKIVFETCLEINKNVVKEAGARIDIVVRSGNLEMKSLLILRDILISNKGEVRVYLRLINDNKEKDSLISLGRDVSVALSAQLINKLRGLSGVIDVRWYSKE